MYPSGYRYGAPRNLLGYHVSVRLLHLLRSLNPADGGPIEAVRLISLEHTAAGHHVELASLDEPGDPIGNLPFPVHLLGPARGNFGHADKLIPWLRAHHSRFDGVIVNGLWQYHGLGCRKALRGTKTPYFVFPHGMLDPWFKRRYPMKHLKKWLYWPWGDYRVLRDASGVLFTCEEERVLAPQSFWLYRVNPIVTGLGTRSPTIELEAAEAELFSAFPRLTGKRIVLFMGRIHPKKGCDLLLQAFARAFKSDLRWHLLVVGPDQVGWQQELQALAEKLGIGDRVCWAGPRMGRSKWGARAAAEVFALPSHQENFGIAVVEALACGTPVLISDKVNIWREIEEEKAGMVSTDTAEATARLLSNWAALSESERQGYSGRAKQCFQKHFDIRVCAEAVLAAVRAVKA